MILNTYRGTYSEWLEKNKPIRELQKLVKTTPKGFTRFVNEVVFAKENYFFYGKSKTGGHCSACHTDVPLKKGQADGQTVKHKASIICPNCQKEVICISETHYSKPKYKYQLESCKWAVIPETKDGYLITRYVRNVKTFDTTDGTINSKEVFRTFWDKDLNSTETAYHSDPFDKYLAWVPYAEPSFGFWNENTVYSLPQPSNTYLYNANKLADIVKDTGAKYSGMAEYFSQVLDPAQPMPINGWALEHYIQAYKKHHCLEQLAKCGFIRLATDLICYGYRYHSNFCDGKDIMSSMKIDHATYKFLLAFRREVSFDDIDLLKEFTQKAKRLPSKEEFSLIRKNPYSLKFICDFMNLRSLHKLAVYAERQSIKLRDYEDYLSFLRELSIRLDDSNLFPKNFKTAHDRRCAQVKEKHDQEALEKKRKEEEAYQKLVASYGSRPMESEELIARYPLSLSELKEEGESLHHCVGSYTEKVARGETSIIFIRKKNEPNVSYYTMEYRDGHIAQVRGRHNADAPAEVMAFAKYVAYCIEKQCAEMQPTSIAMAG